MVINQVSNKKRVEVSLFGQRFTLRSDKNEEYVQAVAQYVTSQLENVAKQSHSVSTHHVALLTALNLADQLLQKEDELLRIKQGLKNCTEGALREVQDALSLLPHHHTENEDSIQVIGDVSNALT
jgi:cell division protein ZapA